jgi:hypothetical protein
VIGCRAAADVDEGKDVWAEEAARPGCRTVADGSTAEGDSWLVVREEVMGAALERPSRVSIRVDSRGLKTVSSSTLSATPWSRRGGTCEVAFDPLGLYN